MLQRPFSCSLAFGLFVCLVAPFLRAQTAVPDANGRLVFKANARIVVLDVVVTGQQGKPVEGLRKEDFSITEDGRPQQITSFEEHTAGQSMPAKLPDLPPNVFTNIPRVKPTDSVTVLLLDSLNSPVEDQSFVRTQMLKFLKTPHPGMRIAIFTLGTRLRFVEGFTDDPEALASALSDRKNSAESRSSPLLQSNAENDADQQAVNRLYQNFAANPSSVNLLSLQSVQQFQAEQVTFKTDERVNLTLDAFQQLARYLAGIPGRKNVIWFSAAFPLNLFPNPDLNDTFVTERKYDRQIQKTDALLSAAEVAIYPIAAEGAATDTLYNSDQAYHGKIDMQEALQAEITHPGQPQTQAMSEQAQGMETDSLQKDSQRRNADHTAMDVIAGDTGGDAIYNTNGLDSAVTRVIDHGSRFYTLTYTPGNNAADGRYRKIAVQVSPADTAATYKLAYRRGYFAEDAKAVRAASKKVDDPLHPFMGPGMPASTQVLYALRVKAGKTPLGADPVPELEKRASPTFDNFGRYTTVMHTDVVPEPSEAIKIAGDNPKLKGPFNRYSVDFVIASRSLQLDETPNGGRHGSIETTLVIYDRQGRPLNWLVRQFDLGMDAARYAQVQENGINFQLDIDAPGDGVTLRSGIYDLQSNLTGTFEIPLASVLTAQAPGLKSR